MSYSIRLKCPVSGKVLELDEKHHMKGGTYLIGGSKYCKIDITYNYAPMYYGLFPQRNPEGEYVEDRRNGIRYIYGMSGAESIPVLQEVISKLGDDVSSSYWDATEGNAKKALTQLLALARMRPDGIWDGD